MQQPAFTLFFLCFATFVPLAAQEHFWRPGELLLQLSGDADIHGVTAQLKRHTPTLQTGDVLSDVWRIYRVRFDPDLTNEAALISAARRTPGVAAVQRNYRTEERSITPNDSLWSRQTNFQLLGTPDAWEYATGGLTPAGDTIVVAVLEKGAIMTHPDLRNNAWRNRFEIPNDGIDNDNNGYIDDYRGWNPRTRSDDPGEKSSHGTSVNGIIGAEGNNKIGVAGINWRVKLMNIANVQFEDEIIAAYQYVYKARRAYNQSNGIRGAFVVASNASFGLNAERSSDHLIWCSMYDSLGAVGVLSAGATTNSNVDVDIVGDMPTTCPSEFMIGVTNTDNKGAKVTAGYGAKSIDLGAPGENAFAPNYNNINAVTYGAFAGTSSATPEVTGVIALLYSYKCATLTVDALTNPVACARRIRDMILKNVTPEPTLKGITVTGGRLDLAGPSKAIRELCFGSSGLLGLSVRPNPVSGELSVDYETPDFESYVFRVFNAIGQLIKEETVTPPQFGKKTYKFDATNLPQGVYIISINQGKKCEAIKFVKK